MPPAAPVTSTTLPSSEFNDVSSAVCRVIAARQERYGRSGAELGRKSPLRAKEAASVDVENLAGHSPCLGRDEVTNRMRDVGRLDDHSHGLEREVVIRELCAP